MSRAKKLDAIILDNELERLLFEQLKSVLDVVNISAHSVDSYRKEFELLIKLFLWRYTVNENDSSIGHHLLNLKLVNGNDDQSLKTYQSFAYAMFKIILPYYDDRFGIYLHKSKYYWFYRNFYLIYKVLDLINLLIFFRNGEYLDLWARIFQVKLTTNIEIPSSLKINSSNILIRNLLQQSLAESLAYILPIFSVTRLRNKIFPYLFTFIGAGGADNGQCNSLNEEKGSGKIICSICNENAVNVQKIDCGHYYCYYCLMSNYLYDVKDKFDCSKCSVKIDNANLVKFSKTN